jgi:hypothetical protein
VNAHLFFEQFERPPRAESGFVVVAELTGMPGLAAGGLGHAPRNRAILLDALTERLAPGLRVESIDGDRLVATARDGDAPNAAVVLDLVDAAYHAFRAARQALVDRKECTCDACARTARVALRVVAHHGRWSSGSQIADEEDVKLAITMLDEHSPEPGSRLLLTNAALRRTQIDPDPAGMRALAGGSGAVVDLELAWERNGRAVRLDPEDVVTTVEVVLPVGVPAAWDWLTAPDKRTLWEEVDSIESIPRPDGRAGVGTRYRSLHGKQLDEVREVIDWRPFRSWTWDLTARATRVRATVELFETEGGTRVVNTIGVPEGSGPITRLRARRAIRARVAPRRIRKLEQLRALLTVERSLAQGFPAEASLGAGGSQA